MERVGWWTSHDEKSHNLKKKSANSSPLKKKTHSWFFMTFPFFVV